MAQQFGLSKSRVLSGLQCERRLWLETHKREVMEISPANEIAFAQGNALGEVARSLLGSGRLIEHVDNIGLAIQETAAGLESEQLLFEPAFHADGVVARADGLKKVSEGWHLIEVKGATAVKDYYLRDCAVQAWVLSSAGAPVKKVTLAHVDSSFVYQGDGDYDGLLRQVDVTREVAQLSPDVPEWIAHLRNILAGDEPKIASGAHCREPHDCPFTGYCESQEPPPPEHPVSLLSRAGKLAKRLAAEGITDLRDVPEAALNNDIQRRIHRAHVTGKPILEPVVRKILQNLGWPRYYVDFETIALSVPLWAGARPYQQVPFQWSCHVQTSDGTLTHTEFLDTSGASPIANFASSLLEALGNTGPIFVYNQSFEASRIKELAQMQPTKAKALLTLNERMVDLLPITREHYYHPDMKGSFSIKAVLPTVAPDLDYSSLYAVQNGGTAQQAWMEIVKPQVAAERKEELCKALLKYCELDTLAMVRLVAFLSIENNERPC